MIRSNLGGHYAGTGMEIELDEEELYQNHSVLVRLEHDYVGLEDEEFDDLCRKLSGEVKTYNLKEVTG